MQQTLLPSPDHVASAMPLLATMAVFVSVAIAVAAICYRFLYAHPTQPQVPPLPPPFPPPLPAMPVPPQFQYCSQCGQRHTTGTPMCACGAALAPPPTFQTPGLQIPAPPPPPLPPPIPMARPRSRNSWSIYDMETARKVAHQGMWTAFFIAIVTAAVSFLAGAGVPLIQGAGVLAWLDAVIFAGLGFGIRSMSRIAAIAALVLYLVERIMMAASNGLNPIMLVIVVTCFAQGVRGTFAFHKYREQSSATPYDNRDLAPY